MALGLFNLPGSFPLGSLFGIPVRLHVLFLVLLVLQVAGSAYYRTWYMLIWFILLGPVLLITILCHELGHCLAARSVGGEVHGILLWPLGGLAFIGHTAGPKADIWVAVAGPLTHIPMVIIWILLLLPAYHANTGSWHITLDLPYPDKDHLWQAICAGAVNMNISLCLFNLLVPAYPLDGGRILVDSLLACGVNDKLTAKITIGVAVPIALGLAVLGIIEIQLVTFMVGMFILLPSYQLFQALQNDQLQHHPMFAFDPEDSSAGGPYTPFGHETKV